FYPSNYIDILVPVALGSHRFNFYAVGRDGEKLKNTINFTVGGGSGGAESSGTYSGTGPVASWRAYQYRDTDGVYHQAIQIYSAKGAYPVIGYSYSSPGCLYLGDTFNDFWQPIGNGLWWFINRPRLVYVKWVWYDNSTSRQIL